MRITWTCQYSQCKHKQETTSPTVERVDHKHGNNIYHLIPYKKERKLFNPKSVKTLKKEVNDLFSEYIRRRYVMPDGFASCVTCGCEKKWQEQQAGHFVSRSKSMTLFDEKNVHVQCYHCNMTLKGNMLAYHQFMLDRYGQEEIDRLQRLAKVTHQFKPHELENIKKDLQAKLKELQ